ncbi:uncharacterized protein LOC124311397 isoform X1 [Daphnia pulicaria]|uniref:uncharacterized protein LOC124311397 isoform X1 n=1 Tax=Daphnia pulicaria TaxID=35523 RepID=UPI001EEB7359|nr:uncharacterized protein LOC124311397 isoform X1 [Daphnia pulicaria]
MAANMSFICVCLIFIHLVYSGLPLKSTKFNRQSKSTLRSYQTEFFNEVFQDHWDRKMRTLDPEANKSLSATCDAKAIAAENRNAKCKPRLYVVALEKIEGFKIEPSHVEVMRCKYSKCSSSAQHCLPSTTQIRKLSVYALKEPASKTKKNGSTTCMQMEVEEHVSCKCGCLIKPKDCQKPAIYSKNNCRCECPNRSEAHTCEQNGFKWNQSICRCIQSSPLSTE